MLGVRKEKGESVSTFGMMNGSAAPFIKVCPQVCPTMVVIIENVHVVRTQRALQG